LGLKNIYNLLQEIKKQKQNFLKKFFFIFFYHSGLKSEKSAIFGKS